MVETILPAVLSRQFVPNTALFFPMLWVICNKENGTHHIDYALGTANVTSRYINTNYIIASYLDCCKVRHIKISYDIACQWSINLRSRFTTCHGDVDLTALSLTYLIPKFHLPAHGPKCQVQYSFNHTHGVGRTHGETVEQEWAYINLAALST